MKCIAVNLGASSGRLIMGELTKKNKLKIEEIYRFPNGGVQIGDSLYWDLLYLYQEIKKGIKECIKHHSDDLKSIGIDSWGVDFVILDKNDELIGPVHHYRDKRTEGILDEMFKAIPKEEIFAKTGIQFMEINSSVQLYSMVRNSSPRLDIAETFLMIPDYFHYLLSGVKTCEYSNVTTTQLYDHTEKDWFFSLIDKLGFKRKWFKEIIPGGTIIAPILPNLSRELGLSVELKIIAPLTHDTGSAFIAVPVEMDKYDEGEYAILSSGTWSLLGLELNKPILDERALEINYTNEGGINGSIRFLKNITGLWLIQECKKQWDEASLNLNWNDIEKEAINATPFQHVINPDHQAFLNPQNMIDAIKEYCKKTGQTIPETVGEISRCVFESLAFRYREIIENLEKIIKKKIKILHIIGGGSQNKVLNQFAANALGINVKAGPSEATAIGNLLVQAMALGEIKNLPQLREIVLNSFEIKEYQPKELSKWNLAFAEYMKVK